MRRISPSIKTGGNGATDCVDALRPVELVSLQFTYSDPLNPTEKNVGCVAWFCPCIVYSKNKHRLEHLTQKGFPDPEQGGECCTGDCMIHAAITCCFGAGWILQVCFGVQLFIYFHRVLIPSRSTRCRPARPLAPGTTSLEEDVVTVS